MKDELQTWLDKMGDGGCLALDYIFSTLKGTTMDEYTANCYCLAGLLAACERGIVDDEGFVNNAKDLMEFVDSAHIYSVEKRKISSIKDLGEKETAAVLFEHNGHGHWVLVDNRVIVFDSLNESICRKYGKVTDARVITRKDKEEK